MARAPIIISNGGVIDLLSEGLAEKVLEENISLELQKEKVKDKLKENIKTMIRDWDKTEIVILNNAGVNTPYLYWRKTGGDSTYYETLMNYGIKNPEEVEMNGEEGDNIKDLFERIEK